MHGPGEAKDSDFGVAGGKGVGAFIEKGKVVRSLGEKDWVEALVEKIKAG